MDIKSKTIFLGCCLILLITLYMVFNVLAEANTEGFRCEDIDACKQELAKLRTGNCNDLQKLDGLERLEFTTPEIDEKSDAFFSDFMQYFDENTKIYNKLITYEKPKPITAEPSAAELKDFIGTYLIVPYQYINVVSLYIKITLEKFIIYEEIANNKLVLMEYNIDEISKDLDNRFPPATLMITMKKYYVLNDTNLNIKQISNLNLLRSLFGNYVKYLLNYNDGVYKLYNNNKHLIFELQKM